MLEYMKHKADLKRDLKIGEIGEKKVHPFLESKFNTTIVNNNDEDKFANFDFRNETRDLWIEHKERYRYNSTGLNTYYFDEVKLNRFRQLKQENPSIRGFIVWTFKDTRKIWEVDLNQLHEDGETCKWYIEPQHRDFGKGYKQHRQVVNVYADETIKFDDFQFMRT